MSTYSIKKSLFASFATKKEAKSVREDLNLEEFVKSVLEAHNKYRAYHDVQPLKLDKKITKYSQQWAEKLMKKRSMQHSPKSDRPDYGENIYWCSSKLISPNSAVESWYNECSKFNYEYGKEPTNLSTGHFTQVVWKKSEYLGVGIATSDGGIFVVCNYQPAGNYIGQYCENVLPPNKNIPKIL